MKVIVCGGRNYSDMARLFECLDLFHKKHTIDIVIHGDARGADWLAEQWAVSRGIHYAKVPALWRSQHGKAAGPMRNKAMLELLCPDAVIAFPGGTGTAHMVKIAQDAHVRVWEITNR